MPVLSGRQLLAPGLGGELGHSLKVLLAAGSRACRRPSAAQLGGPIPGTEAEESPVVLRCGL